MLMADRTRSEILDEIVYAVQCAYTHYGPSLSRKSLSEIRIFLEVNFPPWTDASYLVDVEDDDKFVDFHNRIQWEDPENIIPFEDNKGS